ncbi:MAG: trehalose-6-phosphate synthase [Thermoleophilia bacterium]|nr:trehalose-6-phosphate synthase [Thermoleophilia bacterium]
MPGRRKLIIVSNRGPVGYTLGHDGELAARRGGGGLVTALRSLVSHHDVTWIASVMSEGDRLMVERHDGHAWEERARDGSEYRLRLVWHPLQAYDWYYNVVANPVLWFAQHYLWDLAASPDWDHGLHNAWHNGYLAVNANFASAVLSELEREPDAAVFFHDYHLYVVPRLVRERAPQATLAHFVHIPWPQADYWRVLPEEIRRAVHEGMLANDVVGFHTERWRRNFLRSCEDIVEARVDYDASEVVHGGRRVAANARPISVDPPEFEELSESDAVLSEEATILSSRRDYLVLRVDRTDPSKNVVRGLRAYELFLEAHPELHGRVQMLALLDPSRQDIPEYAEYLAAIQRAARTVNDRFQQPGWVPLDLQIADNFAQSVAAYKQFDVLLVNAIFDGLNLVAKEAPLVNERDGVLVLSENTGVHEELGDWALTVNPFDVAGQAEAIFSALTMSAEERRRRIEAIRTTVREHDIGRWIADQLADLERADTGPMAAVEA